MSIHSFTKINQKEYLKKYLSGDKGKKKKKKKDKKHKKLAAASVNVKIIDDDINDVDTGIEVDEELLLAGEDAPQIVAEYIEEQPVDKNVLKWKSIVIKDEPEDDTDCDSRNETDLWGRNSDGVRIKQEQTTGRKHEKARKHGSSPSSSLKHCHKSSENKISANKSPSRYRKGEDFQHRKAKIKTEPQSPLCKDPSQNEKELSFDASPQRRRISDNSPSRRGKSPSRNSKKQSSDQLSPVHRRGTDQFSSKKDSRRRDSDQSPSRIGKNTDQSPRRHRKNVYESPERRKSSMRNERRNSDQSPPRRSKIRDSDQSPPRKSKRRDSDQSPRRKFRNSSDESPPYKRRSSQTPEHSSRRGRKSLDQSPLRKKRNTEQSSRKTRYSPKHKNRSPDQSPPRRSRKSPIETRRSSPTIRVKREKRTPDLSPQPRRSRWEQQELEKSLSPPPTHKPKPGKTLEGKKAGLQDAKALQTETMKRRKQEDHLFEKMSSDISGRNAEVQVRSTGRKGRRAKEAREENSEERRRKEEHEEKKKLRYERWGKGLKQIEDHKNRMLEEQYESSKPLARYSNDEDLERHLKEQERAEDPMLEYMRQKRKEKEKQSGKPQIPRYEGPFPENRFGIRPGYRWDGVDRSNGYEKKYFAVHNEKKARQDEAYKYSVEDM